MGARALDDLAIGFQELVGLARQWRDLVGKSAFEAFGPEDIHGDSADARPR